ncbi:MAG: hypothetical protein M1464_04870 [Candidatus Thermoplasmatota archaeon]|nr:hypothetical protein [Candidatus Thermoplasmatota archaeon]
MINEEYRILGDTVKEFSEKNLEGSSLKIERGGAWGRHNNEDGGTGIPWCKNSSRPGRFGNR